MGEGKTEAALLLYDTLASRGAHGLYFALPTQATANQILGRVERYLARSFPGEPHGLHLVHGGAGLSDRYGELKRRAAFATRSVGDVSRAEGDQGPVADGWFARSKRALLAPIAVGTVDQALLGVLRSRHHFLRLHGLAGKVVVVDEVHAYETFTAEILARLCAWLRAMGSTVVLLSATLASPQRARLLQAYGIDDIPAPAPYPRITVARDGQMRTTSFEARRPPIEIAIEWKNDGDLLRAVAQAVRGGGCVAWIVNTVARAQSIYGALCAIRARAELPADIDLSLLHARFPFAARQDRERTAEEAFGPPGRPDQATKRPRAAILVDAMVSPTVGLMDESAEFLCGGTANRLPRKSRQRRRSERDYVSAVQRQTYLRPNAPPWLLCPAGQTLPSCAPLSFAWYSFTRRIRHDARTGSRPRQENSRSPRQ